MAIGERAYVVFPLSLLVRGIPLGTRLDGECRVSLARHRDVGTQHLALEETRAAGRVTFNFNALVW